VSATPDGRLPARALADYRWLSFDVVGTLIDFETGIVDCIRGVAQAPDVVPGGGSGAEPSDERILECFAAAEDRQQQLTPQLPFTQMLDPIYRRMAGELDLPAEQSSALRDSIADWPAFPDAVEALGDLAERFRLVALTNADNGALDTMAATLGRPFADTVTAEDVGVNKPDPQVFAYCAGRQSASGYTRDGWLHVAQSQYHDIATAERMGVATCWIEGRQGQAGFGATPSPPQVTEPATTSRRWPRWPRR